MKLTEYEKQLLILELISLEDIKISRGLIKEPKYKKIITKEILKKGICKEVIVTTTKYERMI
ncbi:hypothetical protein FDE77_09810 [Clostridium botulinum]|nr:hypothetical protein [Clostridium botulinum]